MYMKLYKHLKTSVVKHGEAPRIKPLVILTV